MEPSTPIFLPFIIERSWNIMNKQFLYDTIEKKAPLLKDLSDRIWEYAELSMLEYRSVAAYIEILKAEGFSVTEELCGIPTAFKASFGSGRPVIGILGEYDALEGISQEAGVPNHAPIAGKECGHGCGHNLLGAGALGAAIAIKEAIAAGKLTGTVVFYGCPGEEGCAGKTFMAWDGQFRDLDAAITWHPGDTNEVTVGSNAACLQVAYSFTGISAHAAGDPWNGRSALDAAELMNIGVQFLREHMEPKSSIHYAFADAGCISPNVVQSKAKLIYMVRGETVRKAKALLARVDNIAKGAAMMTDCTVTMQQLDGTANTLSNTVLEQLLQRNFEEVKLPEYTQQELAYAAALRATFPETNLPGQLVAENMQIKKFVWEHTDGGKKDLNDFVIPYAPACPFSPGSTDVGDVSWLTPTAQITTVTQPSGTPGHSWQTVSCGKTGIAHKGMLLAAQVLAGAAADLMTQPEILAAAQEEFRIAAMEGYDCPIGPEVTPNPQ